ncbi:LacI family DNA-binding transcriptional regulator [Bradyrhizobium sp. U87765 SZCCT0131]|uniref:LacI family DNA-binding transcriptional regulator n=1 Tax=unclassified Bradyrhizobium TaxID=2631580 RepID=UPI001BAD0B6F|nr:MULTISPECIES: LacI family DNA-binding transcriptional regulator [unclassified Bradyrhizobium]MBR1221957.1 LacI family DNA-binding transcriptional regulator [Bradyrhizobium sp. U87765 SZCCT0131]MBR1263845.1 LacI family DNA-binding transcriptional regulator [Bradyrhizobium sp. U87765 SZCCT0134]MBR1302585.1 LacI family DNA-binding transcriptional regulator [Bradyrhizobium sp. U87765 SZCCT0110]MBR1320095.1 LacI family DNA-binding transcriptional regulator [Bradyrhizobium sp. U87765 SZCCT0109]MB
MATIRDVARLANVSVTTVSNVINSPDKVSPELLARVQAAIDKLGYAPHAAARSLRKRASGLLGLIVGDITNPFFSELFEAVEVAAAERGFSVILCNANENPEREETHLRMLRTQRIDGLILAPSGVVSMNRAALLAALEIPVVLVDRAMEGLGYDAVVLDNHRAAYDATSHVIACGHRRIALINGSPTVRTATDRLQGYREALLAAGVAFDADLVRDAGFREQPAHEAALALLRQPDRPTAIFTTNNLMTIGVLRAVAELGLSCPADVSLIGIDDLPWAEAVSPRLTMVAQPVRAMGEAALNLLARRLAGSHAGPGTTVVMEPRLIVRNSCAAPARESNTLSHSKGR